MSNEGLKENIRVSEDHEFKLHLHFPTPFICLWCRCLIFYIFCTYSLIMMICLATYSEKTFNVFCMFLSLHLCFLFLCWPCLDSFDPVFSLFYHGNCLLMRVYEGMKITLLTLGITKNMLFQDKGWCHSFTLDCKWVRTSHNTFDWISAQGKCSRLLSTIFFSSIFPTFASQIILIRPSYSIFFPFKIFIFK